MAGDNVDSSKDATTASTVRPTSSVMTNGTPGHPSSSAQDAIAHSPLELFQWLVGIHTPPFLMHTSGRGKQSDHVGRFRRFLRHFFGPAKQSDNVGLYQRAKDQERRSRIAYLLTSYISNTLFLLQIMLAAAFTGLSAYKEANAVTLTILGAFNTVVAGCLAWQKGQGVPQRYRKAQDQYQNLILEIEMAERTFIDLETANGTSGILPDPHVEKEKLQKLYDTARADQQANYPDLYVSTGATSAKAASDLAAISAKAASDLTTQLEETKAEAAKVRIDLLAKFEALAQKLEVKFGDRVEGMVDDARKK